MSIDWAALRAAATAAASRAYAPYSGLRVGAAGQTSDGRIIVGCNVENASFGLTLCAECGLVSAFHAAGPSENGTGLMAVAVVAGDGEPLLPCGRCRQLLLEAGGGGLLVDTADGPVELKVLLPAAFTTADLAERREPQPSEPQPSEPQPSEPRPSEPRPSEPRPSESRPSEPQREPR